jgi:ParB family chromosome partitioning protein
MARSDKVSSSSETINDLALRRAAIGSAPLPPLAKGGVLVEVELDKIEPNPDQPRQWIDPEKIEELAASIASRGTRQPDNPILVRLASEGDRFVLVSGERRWRAKQLLRERAPTNEKALWNTIKALLQDDIDDEKSAFIALEENLQREDLSPVEEGAAYVRLMERFSARSTKALAARIGKPENRIQQMIRLHGSPQFLRDAVMKGALVPVNDQAKLTEGGKPRQTRRRLEFRAAFEFLKLFDHLVGQDARLRENPKAREKIETRVAGWVDRALAEGWSVRRVEEQCAALKTGKRARTLETAAQVQLPPIETSGGRLVVHSGRLVGLDSAAKHALLAQVIAFLGLSDGGHHVVANATPGATETATARATKG